LIAGEGKAFAGLDEFAGFGNGLGVGVDLRPDYFVFA
jgi:hypothetical protein